MVGAPYNDALLSGNTNVGHVRIYAWDGSNWTQMGSDIDGEAAGDWFGSSVSIDSSGTKILVGTPYNDGDFGSSNDNTGHARAYQWNGSNWTQIGTDIDGESSGDYFGQSVSINSSGNTLAIGGPHNEGVSGNSSDLRGHTRVFEWGGSSWNQKGQDIDGVTGDRSGSSVSINSSGNKVVIGAPY